MTPGIEDKIAIGLETLPLGLRADTLLHFEDQRRCADA